MLYSDVKILAFYEVLNVLEISFKFKINLRNYLICVNVNVKFS